jgi:hypothetical protein
MTIENAAPAKKAKIKKPVDGIAATSSLIQHPPAGCGRDQRVSNLNASLRIIDGNSIVRLNLG